MYFDQGFKILPTHLVPNTLWVGYEISYFAVTPCQYNPGGNYLQPYNTIPVVASCSLSLCMRNNFKWLYVFTKIGASVSIIDSNQTLHDETSGLGQHWSPDKTSNLVSDKENDPTHTHTHTHTHAHAHAHTHTHTRTRTRTHTHTHYRSNNKQRINNSRTTAL